MGQRRREGERDVSGIVLLDKPAGITSNAALQTVKRLFRARKAGHTGSLDPLATGLLPICLGEATKLSGFLLDADKRYRTEIRLGVTTTTGDAEGETLRVREVADLDRARVAEAVARFTGEIEQIPPMHSALKRNGMPLYKLARQGIEVERAPRPVVIHALELVRCEADRIELDVRCSKGTYIRVLAEDIGEALGCGAHVGALRRTGVGGFDAGRMVALETLRAVAEQQGRRPWTPGWCRWRTPCCTGRTSDSPPTWPFFSAADRRCSSPTRRPGVRADIYPGGPVSGHRARAGGRPGGAEAAGERLNGPPPGLSCKPQAIHAKICPL